MAPSNGIGAFLACINQHHHGEEVVVCENCRFAEAYLWDPTDFSDTFTYEELERDRPCLNVEEAA